MSTRTLTEKRTQSTPIRPANFISAAEARAEAQETIKGPGIAPYLEVIYGAIRVAMKAGAFYIQPNHHFDKAKLRYPMPEVDEAIQAALKEAGYTVKNYDEDTSHSQNAYYEVWWK
jgi:hypothetical protein